MILLLHPHHTLSPKRWSALDYIEDTLLNPVRFLSLPVGHSSDPLSSFSSPHLTFPFHQHILKRTLRIVRHQRRYQLNLSSEQINDLKSHLAQLKAYQRLLDQLRHTGTL